MRLVYRQITLTVLLALLSGCARTGSLLISDPPLNAENARRAAEKVLLGIEHGVAAPVVSRWKSSPVMAVEGAGPEDEQMLEELVRDLNSLIQPAGVRMKKPGRFSRPNFFIYFLPRSEFHRIGEEHGFRYLNNYPGFFTIWWDGAHVIYKAVVMIDSGLSENRRRHFVYEEVTQAMGLSNDQPFFRSSIFFEKGRDGGSATDLGELDRRLIAFLYRYLRPGDGQQELREAFDAHWHKTSGVT